MGNLCWRDPESLHVHVQDCAHVVSLSILHVWLLNTREFFRKARLSKWRHIKPKITELQKYLGENEISTTCAKKGILTLQGKGLVCRVWQNLMWSCMCKDDSPVRKKLCLGQTYSAVKGKDIMISYTVLFKCLEKQLKILHLHTPFSWTKPVTSLSWSNPLPISLPLSNKWCLSGDWHQANVHAKSKHFFSGLSNTPALIPSFQRG